MLSAANNIQAQRQAVDALNVFPVPDGDTGTNMSMTIGAAARELQGPHGRRRPRRPGRRRLPPRPCCAGPGGTPG